VTGIRTIRHACISGGLRALVLALGLMAIFPLASAQTPQDSNPQNTPPPADSKGADAKAPDAKAPDPKVPDAKKTEAPTQPAKPKDEAAQREEERQAKIVADTERLYAMIQDLKAEVAKSSKDTLSVSVVKKASEIEKLARSLKERMRTQ
jgi:hypothetical protein